MGVTGDFILDTATPFTQIGDTQAEGAGYADTSLVGEVRIAGLRLKDRPVQVARLDLRTGAMPTPISGVIGADVLKGFVLDVSFAPCRVALWRPGHAPPFPHATGLPLTWIGGIPTATAAVSDGQHSWRGTFAIATGAPTPVRINEAYGAAPGASPRTELYPGGAIWPTLRALSFGGVLFQDAPSGLLAPGAPELAGQIGAPVLSHWRLRFDFPAQVQVRMKPARFGKVSTAACSRTMSPRLRVRAHSVPNIRASGESEAIVNAAT
jgi:hypothetical protein